MSEPMSAERLEEFRVLAEHFKANDVLELVYEVDRLRAENYRINRLAEQMIQSNYGDEGDRLADSMRSALHATPTA